MLELFVEALKNLMYLKKNFLKYASEAEVFGTYYKRKGNEQLIRFKLFLF